MQLQELLSVIEPIEIIGSTDKEINGLHFDSRKIGAGDLFVAQVGTAVDGHTFIEGCIEKGAAAVVLSNKEYIKHHVYSCREHRQGAGPVGEQVVRRTVQSADAGRCDGNERQNDHRHLII